MMAMNRQRKRAIRLTVDITLNKLNRLIDRSIPINIKRVVAAQGNCRLVPFSKHMSKFNLSYSEMIVFAETDDACTFYLADEDKYLIFFNDIDHIMISSYRYRWSIAHELGHVILRHHALSNKTKLFRNQLSKEEYKQFEDEADCFASYLLVPHVALYMSRVRTQEELRKFCKISKAAADVRISEYNQWLENNRYPDWDRRDLHLLEVHRVAKCRQYCERCHYIFYDNTAKFCPICGHFTTLTEEDNNSMIYDDFFELDDDGRVEECVSCSNEDVPEDGTFCQICGAPVVNRCTNAACQRPALGNARFCIHCSAPTTFGKHGVLCKYKDYKKNGKASFVIDEDDSDDIPF